MIFTDIDAAVEEAQFIANKRGRAAYLLQNYNVIKVVKTKPGTDGVYGNPMMTVPPQRRKTAGRYL